MAMVSGIKVDQLIRSRRRTLALIVTSDAQLVVRAPVRMAWEPILDFIRQKSSWILKRQKLAQSRPKMPETKRFIDGEEFFYLGQIYQLKILQTRHITLNGYLEFPERFLSQAVQRLGRWYKTEAEKIIPERVEYYSNVMNLGRTLVRITGARTRWGSCGSRNALNFSWRLMMAPLAVINYVVIHELAHLKVRNHSRKFWNEVEAVLPDYRDQNRWLREHQHLLHW